MKIIRSKDDEDRIYDKTRAYLNSRPRSVDKLHVSDLLYPRKAFFQKTDPKPISNLQVCYFTAGRAHHEIIEACFKEKPKVHWWKRAVDAAKAELKKGSKISDKPPKSTTDSGEHERFGVLFSPDMIWNKVPVEIKTSRMQREPASDDYAEKYSGYLKQLKMYMALMDSARGGLMVFFLGLKNGWRFIPEFRFYKVRLSSLELKHTLRDIKEGAAKLNKALRTKQHRRLELCPSFMCNDCVWFKKCAPWKLDPKRKGAQRK